MTEADTTALRARLDVLREEGKSRQEIADALGVTIYQVKRWISAFGVKPKKVQKTSKPPTKQREKPRYVALDEGMTVMNMAKVVLGPRMGEDHRGYTLDGRPCSSWQLLKAAGVKAERVVTVKS
jgi:predicted transcriptional regulator